MKLALRLDVRRVFLALVAAATVLASAGPALAREERRSPFDEARAVMRVYADCLIRTRDARRTLIAFLRVAPGSPEGRALTVRFATPDCLSEIETDGGSVGSLGFRPELMRGEIFRSLYVEASKTRHPRFSAVDIGVGEPLPMTDPVIGLQVFGNCVVGQNPVSADAAIRQDVASAAEDGAYRTLMPAIDASLQGGSIDQFGRPVLEAVIAEALYKRLLALAAVGAHP